MLRELFAVKPAAMPWKDNLRLVAPVLLALLVFTALGSFMHGMLMALGAYIVLFGAGQPGRRRWRTYVTVSVLLLGAVSLGMVVAGHWVLVTAGYVVVSSLAALGSTLVRIGPPGPYFFTLMVGGGTLLGGGGLTPTQVLPYIVLGNVAAIVFAMGDLLYDRYGSERRAVSAATSAVDSLAKAQAARGKDHKDLRALVDDELSNAAQAVQQAWETVLDGFGTARDEESQRIQDQLLTTHRRYRRCYRDAVAGAVRHGNPAGGDRAPETSRAASAHGVQQRLADSVPRDEADPRRSALGRPSVAYRLRQEWARPSMSLITLARVCLAVCIYGVYSRWLGDSHPFWPVLVGLMILSYPGDQRSLTIRGIQRLAGTAVGIVIFVLVLPPQLNPWLLVAAICVLLWVVSRTSGRNYLYGSVFITLLALSMTVPLTSGQSPTQIAEIRLLDTLMGAVVAIAVIYAVGPQWVRALTRQSARRIAHATLGVLTDLSQGRGVRDEDAVERRRRLQDGLLHSGDATALTSGRRRPSPRREALQEMEQVLTRAGFLVLGLSTVSHDGRVAVHHVTERYRRLLRHPLRETPSGELHELAGEVDALLG